MFPAGPSPQSSRRRQTHQTHRTWIAALLALAILPAAACIHGVPVDTADPLYGARYFVIEPLNFANIGVGQLSEQAYLERKSDKQRQSWEIDKGETAQDYLGAAIQTTARWGLQLQPPPPTAPAYFIVRPTVSHVEPGTFTYFYNRPTDINIMLEIFTPDGRRVGYEGMTGRVSASGYNGFGRTVDFTKASSGTRMRQAGAQLGYQTAVYLARRAGLRGQRGILLR